MFNHKFKIGEHVKCAIVIRGRGINEAKLCCALYPPRGCLGRVTDRRKDGNGDYSVEISWCLSTDEFNGWYPENGNIARVHRKDFYFYFEDKFMGTKSSGVVSCKIKERNVKNAFCVKILCSDWGKNNGR